MLEPIRDLQRSLVTLEKDLRKCKTKQVYKKALLQSSKMVVDTYFRDVRGLAEHSGIDHENLQNLDSLTHSLLEATHKRSAVGTYQQIVDELKKRLLELEKIVLVAASGRNESHRTDAYDLKILDTLSKVAPNAGFSYGQALADLESTSRQSWRGTSVELRESLRECLDYLAPDKEVIEQPGFNLERDAKRPTMKQKVIFVLRKRKSSGNVINTSRDAVEVVEGSVGGLVRSVYDRASCDTHMPSTRDEVLRLRDYVRVVLCELLSIR